MPRPVLVHLNGIPASGKSTTARAWAERHAASMPVAFDIDVLRAMIGGWDLQLRPAGNAARAAHVTWVGGPDQGLDAVLDQLDAAVSAVR